MKLTDLIQDGVARSIHKQLHKVADEAYEEVSQMFPTWWEAGPLQAATAAIHRRLKDEDATPEIVELLIALTRLSAEAIALDVRTSTASAKWLTSRLPNPAGLRDRLVAPLLNEDDARRERRKNIEQYGINADALWAHFAA